MRNNFLIILLFLMGLITKVTAQTNFFTAGGSGDFEVSGSDAGFAFLFGQGSAVRSPDYAFSGGFSLKCTPTHPIGTTGLRGVQSPVNSIGIVKSIVRVRIYVPSTSALNSGATIRLNTPNCTGTLPQSFVVGSSPYNQWVELINIVDTPSRFMTMEILATTPGVFYIDKIEATVAPSVSILNGGWDATNSTFVLTPTVIDMTSLFGSYTLEYQWDDGSTLRDRPRSGITPGTHSVNVKLRLASCNYPLEFYFYFNIDPSPPCPTTTQMCMDAYILLTVGCVVSNTTYTWWSAPTGGYSMGTNTTGTLGYSNSTPGIYSYYVSSTTNGVSSLTRAKVQVTVLPNFTPTFTVTPAPYYPNKSLTFSTSAVEVENYNYTFGDGSGVVAPNGAQHAYTTPGTYQVVIYGVSGCSITPFTTNITINDFQPLCISSLPKGSTGQLKLDKYSGRVSYVYPSSVACAPTPVEVGCISGAVNGPKLDQVVSASAGTFSDDWPYDPAIYVTSNVNPYENGRRGKWRQKASYVYKSDAVYRDKNYNTGTFQLAHFNWNTPSVNGRAGWLLAGNTEKISPHGDALQESNALGIKSSAKFGYRGAVPYLTAKNASYGSVIFEGFEKLYANVFEEGFPLSSAIQDQVVRHSGNASLRIETGGNIPLKAIKFESPSEARPLLVKLWVRLSDWSFYGVGGSQLSSELKVSANGTTPVSMKVVARSNGLDGGSWALCEAVVDGNSAVDVSLMVNYSRSQRIWIDDVRVQPIDSEMNAYVYDIKTLRLLTVFDDQHFGVYYQYNAEGKLVRKMIETERGLKTLEETQYNTPAVTR